MKPLARQRRRRRILPKAGQRFQLCNMTRYGDKIKQHVQAAPGLAGVIAVETHLDQGRGEVEQTYWSKLGWDAQFAPGQWDDTLEDAQSPRSVKVDPREAC